MHDLHACLGDLGASSLVPQEDRTSSAVVVYQATLTFTLLGGSFVARGKREAVQADQGEHHAAALAP